MEKIQIQFKESDYKVYHDYCLKYYQNHDNVRKQSLHAFLDLYEKGIIPIGEQDIQGARQLLAGKCEDLKSEHQVSGLSGDTTMSLQMRVCSDLLLLTQDLEKIYRLIQKQGIVANYLMILGTFSRIIEENRNLSPNLRYDLKDTEIDSLARPLAQIIQERLGVDTEWRPVLHELAVIAARFNQRFPEPRFDRDIAQLIAPAVIAYFDKDVGNREIQSSLPAFLEECELDEFEAFLNQNPEEKSDHEDAVNWDAIHEPLKAIAGAVAAQRNQWPEGSSTLSGTRLPPSPAMIQSPEGSLSPPGPLSPAFPGQYPGNGNKRFAIAVSPDLTTRVESPLRVYSEPDTAPAKPGMQPYIPVIIGAVILVLFIIGTMFIAGGTSPAGGVNTTNSSAVIMKNTTPVKPVTTTAPKATVATNVTTAKTVAAPTPVSYSSADIGNHLVEIAFGPNNNVIQKPQKDLIAIAYSGKYSDSDLLQLKTFIGKFNDYSGTMKISDNVNLNSQGDIQIDFMPSAQIDQVKTDSTTVVMKNLDNGTYYFVRTGDKTYVNSDLAGNERKRWVLRALLFNLGFTGETAKYSDSVFYAGTTNATQLSTVDIKALQLMYGKKITNGMTKTNVKATF
jgi:hypothetical protein